MKRLVPVAILVLTGALSGCSGGMNAMVDTMQYAIGRGRGVEGAALNPQFRYIRVTIDGRVALLALGNEDPHPDGAVEVWFSAEREVVRIQNGRIVGATGLTTEWRNVSLPKMPAWSEIARAGQPFNWVRMRDVMPGYRYGVRDALALRLIPQPSKSALRSLDPQSLTWFEERAEGESPGGYLATIFGRAGSDSGVLPAARYGVDFRAGKETVVYAEQCLAPDVCFSWQHWPVVSERSAGAR